MEKNDQLDKEIEDLENLIFRTQEEEPTVDEEVVEEKQPVETQTIAEDKRFNNYKASTDLTIRDLRSDLGKEKERCANLRKENINLVTKLRALEQQLSSTKSMFSEEDVDILGEPAVTALNKGVTDLIEARIKPLQEETERYKAEQIERELREARELQLAGYSSFLNRLGKLVPDYENINVSQGFIQYMSQVDEDSGTLRKDLFTKAEAALDVGRIASFFNEYKKLINKNTDILNAAITPTGVEGQRTSKSDERREEGEVVITRKFIDKFYDDYNRGKYKTKKGREEAARIEAMIDKAVFNRQVYN